MIGIKVTETDTLYPKDRNAVHYADQSFEAKDYCSLFELEGAEVLGTYTEDFYAGKPAITRNKYGQGAAYFIGARTNLDFLEYFYGELAKNKGLENAWVIKGDPDVSVQSRDFENQSYRFVMNFSEETKEIQVATACVDLITRTTHPTTLTLAPYEVLLLAEK